MDNVLASYRTNRTYSSDIYVHMYSNAVQKNKNKKQKKTLCWLVEINSKWPTFTR